jgi:organic hydroperoxide reductase OsmC/OhrA
MNEFERAAATGIIREELFTLITAKVVAMGGNPGDVLSIAVSACVSTAVAFAATRATTASAAIALVSLTAEGAARDIYG